MAKFLVANLDMPISFATRIRCVANKAKVFFEIDNVIIDANLIKDSLQRQVYLVVTGRQLFG